MCFVFSLVPATVFAIVGYFVLFSSTKTEGVLRTLGRVLAIWIFILAACFPICGAYMSISGQCPMQGMMQRMQGGVGP